MKKIIGITVTVLAAFALAGCGSSTPSAAPVTVTQAPVTVTQAPTTSSLSSTASEFVGSWTENRNHEGAADVQSQFLVTQSGDGALSIECINSDRERTPASYYVISDVRTTGEVLTFHIDVTGEYSYDYRLSMDSSGNNLVGTRASAATSDISWARS